MALTDNNPDRDWQRVVSTAVLGTDRAGQGLPCFEGRPGAMLAASAASGVEQALLDAAALLSVYGRAGRRFLSTGLTLDSSPQDGDRKECSLRAGRQLAKILRGDYGALLPEWADAADRAGCRAPDELLPALLEKLATSPRSERNARVLGVLGERGTWLAQQNPRWQSVVAPRAAPEQVWQTGTRDERLEAMVMLRRTAPSAAPALLASTWAQEPPDDRVVFIAVLREGLSTADEAFLEAALDDKRKPVRTAAADLLARLPESGLLQRMRDRVSSLLEFKAGKQGLLRRRSASLEVRLPEKCDKAMARDGLEDKARGRMGEKAHLVCQMLGATALATWCESWSVEPAELIAAATGCEWKDALIQGWATAAVRQNSPEWAEAILACGYFAAVTDDVMVIDWNATMRGLLGCLAAAVRESLVSETLKHDPFPLHKHPALKLLLACDPPWSEHFSRLVINVVQQHYRSHSDGYDYELRRIVDHEFARRISPSLADEAANGWPADARGWSDANQQMVDTLVATLQFRRDFLKEFNS